MFQNQNSYRCVVGGYQFSQPSRFLGNLISIYPGHHSGIYVLWNQYFSTPQYIGQADSLSNRLNYSHDAIQKMMGSGYKINDIFFSYLIEPSQIKRNQIEKFLIAQYNPPYNVQHNNFMNLLSTYFNSTSPKIF